MRIEQAELKDAEAISTILNSGVKEWAGTEYESLKGWYLEHYSIPKIESNLINPEKQFFVHKNDDEEINGTIIITNNEDSVHFGGLYVTEKRKGVATKLIEYAEKVTYDLNPDIKYIEVYIWHRNYLSETIFEKHGFKLVSTNFTAGTFYKVFRKKLNKV